MTNSEIQPAAPGAGDLLRSGSASEVARNAKHSQVARQSDSPAFRVLLERLQQQANQIESESRNLDDPRALADAVDIARASLDDALSLSDQLLEAFRESQQQSLSSGAADVDEEGGR